MKKINLNSAAFLVLGVFLLLTPALSQAIITSLVTAFFRDIDLLLWVNLAQNFWILNLIPKVVGATLVAGFAWKHLKTRFKVDLPKIKVQTTRLATYSLLFMLCAGLFLFADVPVSEAATTATTGYILDTPVSEHAWLIGAYSVGTYYAIEGSTWDNKVAGVGSTAWASYKTNSTKITELVLDSTTSGAIYMKDVAFDMNLFDDIPEGVRVICSYNAEYWEYINSADSSGSPYTVSVGSGVNVGYYLAADSEGRICFTSSNQTALQDTVLGATTSGEIRLNEVAFDLALMQNIPANVQVVCSYGDEQYTYINSADSLGSPYTVSVGVGVNNGYYLAADSDNRICWSSTNASYVFTEAGRSASLNGGGSVSIKEGQYQLTSPIQRFNRTDFIGANWVGRTNDWGGYTKGTVLKASSSINSFMYTDPTEFSYNINTKNIVFYDPNDYATYGFLGNNSVQGLIEGCKFYQIKRGIYLTTGGNGLCYQWQIYSNAIEGKTDFWTDANSVGIYLGGSDHRSMNNIIGVYYMGVTLSCSATYLTNDHVCYTSSMGIRWLGADNHLIGGEIENNKGNQAVWIHGEVVPIVGGSIIGGRIGANNRTGLRMEGVSAFTVTGVTFDNNGRESNDTYYDLQITGSASWEAQNINIQSNNFVSGISAGTLNRTKYNIFMSGASYVSGINILGNNFANSTTQAIVKVGTAVTIKNNVGWVTENTVSGSNTTATTIVINHGLAGAATGVWCSFNSLAITGYTWTSTGTQITITPTGTLPAAYTVYAKVEYIQ